jgi:hypothetical protein
MLFRYRLVAPSRPDRLEYQEVGTFGSAVLGLVMAAMGIALFWLPVAARDITLSGVGPFLCGVVMELVALLALAGALACFVVRHRVILDRGAAQARKVTRPRLCGAPSSIPFEQVTNIERWTEHVGRSQALRVVGYTLYLSGECGPVLPLATFETFAEAEDHERVVASLLGLDRPGSSRASC